MKAEIATNNVNRALAKFENLTVKTWNQIFESKVQSIICYGAEIWGWDGYNDNKINSVITKFCKNVLGINRSVASCGALVEMGRVTTSARVQSFMLNYFLKTKVNPQKILQRLCIDFELQQGRDNWASRIVSMFQELNLAHLMDEPYTKATRKIISKKVNEREFQRLINESVAKPSLYFFQTLEKNVGGASYIHTVNRKERSALAKFRLGGYIWEAPKRKDGSRVCVLCGGTESPSHILKDCQGVEEIRERVIPEACSWSCKELLDSDQKRILSGTAGLIEAFFKLRKESLL